MKTVTLSFPPWTASPSGVRRAAGDYQRPDAGGLWARLRATDVGVIVSRMCTKSLCKRSPSPDLPQPRRRGWGGLAARILFWNTSQWGVLPCVLAAVPVHLCHTVCAKSLKVARGSRAHPMFLLPGRWRPASHAQWLLRLKGLHNEGCVPGAFRSTPGCFLPCRGAEFSSSEENQHLNLPTMQGGVLAGWRSFPDLEVLP